MSYEVLARKWRPQQFDDVVGQGHVTQTLRNSIHGKRVAHAYIFVGPRGVGKTSIARIFAKALNCRNGPTDKPCDKCESCTEIVRGASLDVLEIDGASNNGVEQVRELRDNVRYAPVRGPFKIYIIDEVHMLSTGAFNALLKTLEEPPDHVKFVFATTEVQKVPATILSRCQRFDLRRITTRDMVAHLGKIAKAEGITISPDALLAIARGAEGGLRDAESALDQLIAFRGKSIEEEDVLSVFGLVARKELESLAGSILRGDVAGVLRSIGELDRAGKDLQRLNIELLEHFRNVLIVAHAGDLLGEQDLTESVVATLKEHAGIVDASRLADLVDILMDLQGQLRYSLSRRTTLEISLVRAARAAATASLDEILAKLQQVRLEAGGAPASSTAPATHAPVASAPPARPATVAAAPVQSHGTSMDLASLQAAWHGIVQKVAGVDLRAKHNLVDGRIVDVTDQAVVIGFDPEFAGNLEQLQMGRGPKILQHVLEDMLKRPVQVQFKVQPAGIAPKAAAAGPAPAQPRADATGKGKQKWVQDPSVKRALETFNGDIVDVHE